MIASKEISALFQLIDDPDEEVFDTVTDRIISIGRGIIPNLENLWENTQNESIQERIELIIYKLHFRDLVIEFEEWKSGSRDLLQGAILFCKYTYPEMASAMIFQEIEKIRRNIWLELNSYLTPLEQANVISGILYSYYNLKGSEVNYLSTDEFLLNNLLENKVGNAISNGILYLIICDMLDIPAKAINIPKQFIIAYFNTPDNFDEPASMEEETIQFYIDPLNGQVYSQKDVDNYFKRISVSPTPYYFKPLNNVKIIQYLLEEYSNCFSAKNNLHKKKDLLFLADMLDHD
ncbi:MAG: transglutaminase-like domain-containing protein [Ginsengibacter sp.]